MVLKVCLAGSGGGHVRQLLDLKPAWEKYDTFFITERTALGLSLAEQYPVVFVEHYSYGQARLGKAFQMLFGAARNLISSCAHILRNRPHVIVTTGAGAVYLSVIFGKFLGAKVIAIESFARFNEPSLFGRMIAPFADFQIIQSSELSAAYPDALVFDPLRLLEEPRPSKKPLIFATVGATLAFPRLSNAVASLKREGRISQSVVLQTGEGGKVFGADPSDLVQVDTLSFNEVQKLLREADIVIAHGGTGSLITALREGCHVIALPRRFNLKEHYDDHQEQIVSALTDRGMIQEADDAESILRAIQQTQHRTPVQATSDPAALISWLKNYFETL